MLSRPSGSSCREQRARDNDALYLARPFVDRRRAAVPRVTLDRIVPHVAVATEDLDGGVCGALCHLARVQLGHGVLARERTAAIAEPGRAVRVEPRGVKSALRLGDA